MVEEHRKGHTEVANDVSGLAIFSGELGLASELVEERGRREFGRIRYEIQAAAVPNPGDGVSHTGLYLYALSENSRCEHEVRRTCAEDEKSASGAGSTDSAPASPYSFKCGNFSCKN